MKKVYLIGLLLSFVLNGCSSKEIKVDGSASYERQIEASRQAMSELEDSKLEK